MPFACDVVDWDFPTMGFHVDIQVAVSRLLLNINLTTSK